ncbi:hypothetical protein [Chitinasiproducens palmae]|uniref:Uncharacterized protein n=1 Tax=Chitinasiproducens palmae TaxID=1770053 RepID=A0A1H2PJ47_9BURK|nr:hypothetical protein [Chitinasiproducens palmae]SDV46240.1 hypothetical protein SAMN05216551_101193 [Chitinasiproducens palmae]
MKPRQRAAGAWRMPVVFAGLILGSLCVALAGGAIGRYLAWTGLACPLLALAWYVPRAWRRPARRTGPINGTGNEPN